MNLSSWPECGHDFNSFWVPEWISNPTPKAPKLYLICLQNVVFNLTEIRSPFCASKRSSKYCFWRKKKWTDGFFTCLLREFGTSTLPRHSQQILEPPEDPSFQKRSKTKSIFDKHSDFRQTITTERAIDRSILSDDMVESTPVRSVMNAYVNYYAAFIGL